MLGRRRVLWVDMVELAWVTILSMYGQQRREHAGAAACALPGVAGEGGLFTDDILRGMTVSCSPFPLPKHTSLCQSHAHC